MRFSCNFLWVGGLALSLIALPACGTDSGDPPTGGSGGSGASGGGGGGGVGGMGGSGAFGGGGDGGSGGQGGSGGMANLDCGDSERQETEACDDGNDDGGDGCSADCSMIEDGYRCPTVGVSGVAIVCGDSRIDPPETCDDGNDEANDGCAASCEREDGWMCPLPGVACVATECGDGIVAGFEQCDDGNSSAPGCSEDCQLEDGFKCETEGMDCEPTVCGDGMREGTEQCDDGNATPFDGCDGECKNEPDCSGGQCEATCGDGVIIPGTSEACDDGNINDGDGCSSACEIEDGFTCDSSPVDLGSEVTIPVIYRDFRSNDTNDEQPATFSWDFNNPDDGASEISFGITETLLDAEGKPALDPAGNLYVYGSNGGPPHSAASFAQWYRTSPTLEPTGNLEIVGELSLSGNGTNVYAYSSDDEEPPGFFPLDDPALAPFAWPNEPTYGETTFVPAGENDAPSNFGFTTEVHYHFVYQGDEVLSFSGDDDLWVFVDGHLCLDVGGLHPARSGVMSFDPATTDPDTTQQGIVDACKAQLEIDKVYEVAIFHAERHTGASNFSLTLDGFITESSSCEHTCGDGVATRFEFCDDGAAENTGAYGHCMPDCQALGPHCGDGNIDDGFEECDDGDNLGAYNGCNPDCTLGPSCGDAVRQPELGEECDAGEQNGEPGSTCNDECEVEVQ